MKHAMSGQHAKTTTSNGKQFFITRKMLTAVARDQRWPVVVARISVRFSKFAFVLFCKITNDVMTGPPQISMFPRDEILGKQNSLFSSGPVIKC